MYFIIFANVFRPSMIPDSKTIRSFSRSMISADSFATSTAVSTDIPISATFIAAASFIPSPINPTVCPFSLSTDTTLDFWLGVSLANTSVISAVCLSSSSSIFSISLPSSIFLTSRPTCLHIVFVTFSLSPVRIFVLTPCSFSAFMAFAADSFGGSRNAR